jgi:formylglycine-generating enzyme required for sulfatase activity
MAGGVAEWVQDWYQEDYYAVAPADARPNQNNSSELKVLRGGSWASPAEEIRATNRLAFPPKLDNAEQYWSFGFRCMQPAP